jgi:hypothetical protein
VLVLELLLEAVLAVEALLLRSGWRVVVAVGEH